MIINDNNDIGKSGQLSKVFNAEIVCPYCGVNGKEIGK